MAGALPQFYERWLGRENRGPEAAGAFDCQNCFMVAPKGLTRDLGPFKSTLKCCTFHPFLPSFTIGALLQRPESSMLDIDRYMDESRLTRLGAFPLAKGTSICETGKLDSTRCAFLSKDLAATCTIRDYRPSTCAGYVCRSSRGELGLKDWRRWEAGIAKFEWSLSHLIAFELGFVTEELDDEFHSAEEAKAYYVRAYELSGDITYIDD
ncbi:hypothetical protein BH10BDE1_BH10BDE1_15250 [soil metagenome]